MTLIHKVLTKITQKPRLYSLLLLPYYFSRFIIISIREKSLWFYRYPPGHHGSTIPSQRDINCRRDELFEKNSIGRDGIELNTRRQLELLETFSSIGSGIKLNHDMVPECRYYYGNQLFRLSDALILGCFLKYLQPKNIIEVGSGFSSALMLDFRESGLKTNLTFIEPYPGNLRRLLRASDNQYCRIIEEFVQDVPLKEFEKLNQNDILFIDSSHVIKIGSDLSTLFFTILPGLKPGVVIHIHDIIWPFEYRESMIREGRIWNEIYLVRSFLQFNDSFEILYFSSYIEQEHRQSLIQSLPNYTEYTGASLWLRKKL